jgi:uncharacterized zinc-type alcohol dehydrogenase-like protein
LASPQDDEYPEVAWGVHKMGEKISPFVIPRAKVTESQVKFDMLYAGVCHTDIHYGKNDFGSTKFPLVPGHELLGKVVEVGSGVTKVKVGDHVAVGCIVDSCLDCKMCSS